MPTFSKKPEHEIWKSPPSIRCRRIEVSNFGRVRSVDFVTDFIRLGDRVTRRIKGKILNPCKDTRGRYFLNGSTIEKRYIGRGFLVHRLVAECFVPNPNPRKFKFVFFKDGDISNCRYDNLVWGSKAEKYERMRGMNSLFRIQVLSEGTLLGEFSGTSEVARFIGTSKQAVWSSIMRGVNRCKGYELRAYKDDGSIPPKTIMQVVDDSRGSESSDVPIPDAIFA